MAQSSPQEIVVFDFDGTSISGNSPVLLVRFLWREGLLRKTVVTQIGLWALCYKLRLPQNESWVRGLVFSAFVDMTREEADSLIARFYHQEVAKRFRSQADEAIRHHRSLGREVWVVSATFEPIILEAMKDHAFTHQFSTRMQVDDRGHYTRLVDGTPVEGAEKIRLVREYADERYGKNGWVLVNAYGDHHSDRPMLEVAQHPCAVTPDRPLRRTAHKLGWSILDWQD